MGEDDGQLALALERPRAGEALEEDAAERVDVRAPVDLAARDLLGRDVVDRSDEAAIAGEAAHRGDVAGEPEVADVGVLAVRSLGDEHVPGLHVAVDEPRLVRRVEGLRDLADEVDCAFRLERSLAPEDLAQVGAIDVRHRQIEATVLRLTGGERRHDVGMVEARRELRLAQEALPEALVLGELVAEQLQRSPVAALHVLGEVNRADGTLADERARCGSRQRCRRYEARTA